MDLWHHLLFSDILSNVYSMVLLPSAPLAELSRQSASFWGRDYHHLLYLCTVVYCRLYRGRRVRGMGAAADRRTSPTNGRDHGTASLSLGSPTFDRQKDVQKPARLLVQSFRYRTTIEPALELLEFPDRLNLASEKHKKKKKKKNEA